MAVVQTPGCGRAGLNGAFNEPSIHLGFNESLPKGHQCSEAYGCLLGVQTVQHSLPAPIHEDRFNHLVIGDARVRLQNDRQGQLRGSNGRVPSLAWPVEGRQFLLERFIEQIVPVMARDATNNLARRIRCTICSSCGERATGGSQ
jgi:hypothetical protein